MRQWWLKLTISMMRSLALIYMSVEFGCHRILTPSLIYAIFPVVLYNAEVEKKSKYATPVLHDVIILHPMFYC